MSLYLKYRPQDFNSVVGQDHIVNPIKNAIKKGDYNHAYLLSGTRGTGKTTLARIIAKALNCTNDNKPCNNCYSCNSITNGTFPDLIEINAANQRGIDDIRQLIDRANYAPVHKVKVYLIDECHMLTKEAANALLKILEEPPANVVFILATTEEDKLLATIKSRCQIHRLRLISKEDIANRIKFISDEESFNVKDDVIDFIVNEAKGSLRDAISLLELVKDMGNIDNIKSQLGQTDSNNVVKLFNQLKENDIVGVFSILKEVESSGNSLESFFYSIEDYLRHIHYEVTGFLYNHLLDSSIKKSKLTRQEVVLLFDCLTKWKTRFLPLSKLNLEVAFSDFVLNRKKQNIIDYQQQNYNVNILSSPSNTDFLHSSVNGNGKISEIVKQPEVKKEPEPEPEIVATCTADYLVQTLKRERARKAAAEKLVTDITPETFNNPVEVEEEEDF